MKMRSRHFCLMGTPKNALDNTEMRANEKNTRKNTYLRTTQIGCVHS